MPPIASELHEEIGKRLRRSREDMLATIRARTGGGTDDRPAISPMARMGSNDDAPAGEMLSHNEEHLAEHETDLLATPTVQTRIECHERIEKEQRTGRGPTM